MRLADLKVSEIILLAENLVTLLSGPELDSIDPAVRASLAAAIGTLPAEARELDKKANNLLKEAAAAFSERDAVLKRIEIPVRSTKDQLKSAMAPKDQFDVCGFNYPFGPRGTYVAQIPSDLAVVGFSNQVNKGTFVGNNRTGAVIYEVWRREGKDGPWMLLMPVRMGEFEDTGVTPGRYYAYKVRASAAKNKSSFSNTAMIGGN